MILELELWDGSGTTRRSMGSMKLREVCRDQFSGILDMAVEVEGCRCLATVQVLETEARTRPWKVVAVALEKLYGGQSVETDLRSDGQCNGVSKLKKRRCQLRAITGTYYCQAHDPLGRAKK